MRTLAPSGSRRGWLVLVAAAAACVLAPVLAVGVEGLLRTPDAWSALGTAAMLRMIATTVLLMVAVAAGTLLLGGGLAWLVSAYRFPGRSLFAWLLVLPLAMPAYVLGFVFLSLLNFAGPVQTALRAAFGPGVWVPEVRSLPAAAVVLSLCLYPYVYLLARAALAEQAPATYEAARALGAGHGRAAWRVVAPMARPSLAAGAALVMLETLTDFATVQYFNVQTVSVAVYQVWKGSFDREAAAGLSTVVLLFALLVIAGERGLRGRARFHQRGGRGRGLPTVTLSGWRAGAASAVCAAVLGAAFAVPIARLVTWSITATVDRQVGLARFAGNLGNALLLAGVAAAGCVGIALIVTHGARMVGGRPVAVAAGLTTAGYAVPGVVVAIGVLVVFAGLDDGLEALGVPGGTGLIATGSVLGICYAYLVRFLALGYQGVDASLAKVSPAMSASALCLGASPRRVLTRVHLPLARTGIGVAAVLVLVDALKELPIVLLLRPFGFETLSVWVWQLAFENFWEAAALPALTIVAVAVLPVLLLTRTTRLPR
ncbi:ABC transporter permease [Pseudonocardia nigra]|uniref:ABC transporter permease n=1 Tax=Pseudonocardia nigra TaxID=1921578 RepID=UPI001C5E6674|nr:iron ABC transporter permease [Pseudonocardia nigra]